MNNSYLLRAMTILGMAMTFSFGMHSSPAQEDERPVVDDSKTPSETAANPSLPTLHLVGDSTLKSNAPQRGWAQEIGAFFDPAKINVVNHAIGGRSSRSFQREGRWDKVVAVLKRGDFVVVQFGHNDQGQYDGPKSKGRPSLPGEGEETAEVTKPDGTTETVHSFGWYMRKFGSDAKAKGATAIFCSMVPHKNWEGDKVRRGNRETIIKWTANAANATDAAYIDLNEIVAREYDKLGPEKVEPLFADARTHTTPAGAELSASCVVAGLRALPGAPLDRYLSAQGKSVKPAEPQLAAGPAAGSPSR